MNRTSLFVALPKNAIIPQLAVHPNRQVAVFLIVLTFRLFFWGIVPGEFICCDPRSCVGGANEVSVWRRRRRRRRVRRRRSRPR